MKALQTTLFIICLVVSTSNFASEINRISLAELQKKANYIVLAQVTNVKKQGNNDVFFLNLSLTAKPKKPTGAASPSARKITLK